MIGYFVISFSDKLDREQFVLKKIYEQVDKLNYFVSTIRKYKAICNKKAKAHYILDGRLEPVMTCTEEQELINSLTNEEDDNPCIVCTFLGTITDFKIQSVISANKDMALIEYGIVESFSDIPFATETNFRTDSKFNDVLFRLSEACYKAIHREIWPIIKTIDTTMYECLGPAYDSYLHDYREYLIQYCEISEQQLERIKSTKSQIAEAINKAAESITLKEELKEVVKYYRKCNDTDCHFKKTAFLFHMLWNNLLINYGYEIIYSISMSAKQRNI